MAGPLSREPRLGPLPRPARRRARAIASAPAIGVGIVVGMEPSGVLDLVAAVHAVPRASGEIIAIGREPIVVVLDLALVLATRRARSVAISIVVARRTAFVARSARDPDALAGPARPPIVVIVAHAATTRPRIAVDGTISLRARWSFLVTWHVCSLLVAWQAALGRRVFEGIARSARRSARRRTPLPSRCEHRAQACSPARALDGAQTTSTIHSSRR
jgi:hypothetical protein